MHYLDANAFIYPTLYEGPKASGTAAFLRSIVGGDEAAATASLTVDEVIWVVSQNSSRQDGVRQGERLLKLPNLRILDVGSQELLRVIRFMDAYEHLSPRDAIHLAAMTEHGIHTIISDDDDFDSVSEVSRVGLDEVGRPDDGPA